MIANIVIYIYIYIILNIKIAMINYTYWDNIDLKFIVRLILNGLRKWSDSWD